MLATAVAMGYQLMDLISVLVTNRSLYSFWATQLLLLRRLDVCVDETRTSFLMIGQCPGNFGEQAQEIIARSCVVQASIQRAESPYRRELERSAGSLSHTCQNAARMHPLT